MKIFKFHLNWGTFNKVPEDERTFALMLGKLHNEINILGNLVASLKIDETEIELERFGRTAQTFMFMTLLSGRLYEGWELLRTNYFGNKLSVKYNPLLGDEGINSLNSIKKYFSNGSALQTIRNKYSFHFDETIIKNSYSSSSEIDGCDMYLGEPSNCNFFQMSESLFNRAILNDIGGGNAQQGMNILVSDSSRILGLFQIFIGNFMMSFIRENWDEFPDEEEVEVGERPSIDEVMLRFLVKI